MQKTEKQRVFYLGKDDTAARVELMTMLEKGFLVQASIPYRDGSVLFVLPPEGREPDMSALDAIEKNQPPDWLRL